MFKFPYISREAAEALETTLIEQLNNSETNPKYYVFQVWGIGGVGKTTLTQKLAEDYHNIADFTIVSFGRTAGIENSIKLMDVLYKNLPNNTSLTNKMFSNDPFRELYQKYWDTINELETTPIQGNREVDSEQQNLVKRLVSEGASALAKSNPATAAVPEKVVKTTAETAVDVGGMILSEADRVRQLLQQHRKTKDKRELKELMLEPLPKLTEAFLDSCKQRKKPIILVLDTYEKISPDIDAWVWKYLIGNAKFTDSNVYVVIAGRNNILKNEPWRKLQQDTQLIYHDDLKRFDEGQTTTYLQQIDIRDKSTIDQIFKITKGLPYYLDKIRERIKRGDRIDFSQLNQDIVSLLLQGLNDIQKQVIYLAACCRWFDQQVIKYLIDQQESLNFDNAVHDEQNKLNCYQWLVKRDFVEYINGKYRLDDVARDVFRQEFWQENEPEFRQTHQQLADYFKKRRNEQLYENSSPAQQYNNRRWREDTSEFLYHQLYAGTANSEIELISYLFTSRYFQQDEIVQNTVGEIIDEVDIRSDEDSMLIYPVKEYLREMIVAVFLGYAVLEECPLDYEYFEQYNLEKSDLDKTLNRCFRHLNKFTGMAKFAALLYKSKRCYPSQQLDYLQQAKTTAEMIATEDDPEFSCDLFLQRLGYEFFKLEIYQISANCCEVAISFKPDYVNAWYNRGVALANLTRFDEAIASWDKALDYKPEYVDAWVSRGLALEDLERFDEAIASYDKALEIKPDDHEVWNNRGNALGKLERLEEAIASYDKALEFTPDSVDTWNNRGIILCKLDRFDEAISSYDKALELKPDYINAWVNRGMAFEKLGTFDNMIASWNKALKIKPDYYELRINLGVALDNLDKFDEAIESYDKALEFKPDLQQAWFNRGIALGKLERFDEAIESYNKALEFKPNYVDVWVNRGITLEKLGRFDEAIASYDKALEFKPDDANIYYNKACTYALQNNRQLAIENLQTAINLDVEYKDMAKTDTEFDTIREDEGFKKLVQE